MSRQVGVLGIEPSASASRTRRSTDDLHSVLQLYIMAGILYIVATPIGNLADITKRALETLKNVDIILCEDTRVSNKLLMHYDIQKPTLSYHQQSGDNKKAEILNYILEGKDIALVTDAGTPGISDPGNELVDFILSQSPDIKVVPVPGPSSLTAALSVCGFNVSNFLFIGFWPKKKASKLIKTIKENKMPVVFFDSPYRIVKTIDFLVKELGEGRRIFVGQELTKLYERSLRGSLGEVKEELELEQKEAGRVRGEIVCVLDS